MPPLLADRPIALQVLIADLVPALYGAICGVVLGISGPGYVVLTLLGILGGIAAGIEHRGALEGAARGAVGGTLFGAFILIGHEIAGTKAKVKLPHPELALLFLTVIPGIILGAIGGTLRERHFRRVERPPPTVA